MAAPAPRTAEQRRRDAESLLGSAVDIWVATASADGVPYLVPLSHHWDGATLLLATAAHSRTARNLLANPTVRLAVGQTRDLCLIDGVAEALEMSEISTPRGDAFAAHAGFDPRTLTTRYLWFRVTAQRVQAWREENEIEDRELMTNGRWTAGEDTRTHDEHGS